MAKKWSPRDGKPTALFSTTHKDRTGGGELYAHQIAKALDGMFDLRYFTGNTGPLHPDFARYHGSRHRFTSTSMAHKSDLFVTCSHFTVPSPYGRHRNAVVTFFPNPDHRVAVKPYDTIITCSSFSAAWVKKYWGKTAKVIYPYIDLSKFRADLKKVPKTILSVGRFFREPHGHSKKQHILIEAFADLARKDPDYRLVLAGSVLSPSDSAYLDYCRGAARDMGVEESVRFRENSTFEELQELYAGAEFYWHANGYGSDNPYETEHFGIVIAEAMASGCTPIVFRNGGYADFPVASWLTKGELVKETLKAKHDPEGMRKHVEMNFTEYLLTADVKDLFFRRSR